MFLFHRRFSQARQVGDISCALAAPRSSAFPPRGTLRVSGPSQRDWPSCPGRTANLFLLPQKKRSLAWGAGTTCLIVPARKRGGKGEKIYVSKPRFHHRLRRQGRTTEVNEDRRPCGGVFRRHQILVEERQRRLRLPNRLASLRGLGVALPIRGQTRERGSLIITFRYVSISTAGIYLKESSKGVNLIDTCFGLPSHKFRVWLRMSWGDILAQ